MFSCDPKSFLLKDGRMTCSDPKLRLRHGLDVSAHQGQIDWKAVRDSGMEFVFLRAAFRGYGTGKLNPDKYFLRNLEGAAAVGLQVGVYVFSQAISVEEALEEAQYVLDTIAGKAVTGPVVFDWEAIPNDTARTDGLDLSVLNDCAEAFCKQVRQAGYMPMVYFNGYEDYRKYDLSRLNGVDIWFAQYQPQPEFYCDFRLWQYTNRGTVPGIEGDTDLNVWMERI